MAEVFNWKGIVIDDERREITINGHKYDFSDIRATNAQYQRNCFGKSGAGVITFHVNDLKNPVHKVKVHSILGKIEENYSRIGILLNLR